MRSVMRFVGWMVKGGVVVLVSLVLLSGLLLALGVRIELERLHAPLESVASRVLGREVRLTGSVALVPTLSPTLEIGGLAIANPPGWEQGEFARVERLRAQLGLVSLLSGEVQVHDVTVEGLTLNLRSSANGEPNWRFGAPRASSRQTQQQHSGGLPFDLVAFDNLTLNDIEVVYTDQAVDRSLRFHLRRLQGAMPRDQQLLLTLQGELEAQPFDLRIETGNLSRREAAGDGWPLVLRGEVAGIPVSIDGALAPAGQQAGLSGSLSVGAIDVGALLQWLDVIDGIQARVGELTATIDLRGDSLSEIVAHSELLVQLRDGAWQLRDANTGAHFNIGITSGEVAIRPGEPVSIGLATRLEQTPLAIAITGAPSSDYLQHGRPLPLRLAVTGAGAELVLAGSAVRPIDPSDIAFELSLAGQRLDTLNTLLGRDLPPLGPYTLAGTFAIVPSGYRLGGLALGVGDTHLGGRLALDTATAPPLLEVDLRSRRLQLDDFNLGDWSPEPADAAGESAAAGSDARVGEQVAALLDHEVMAAQDVRLALAIESVSSGRDRLGSGLLKLNLEQGRLSIDPLSLSLPGGDALLRFGYRPTASAVETMLEAQVEQFDYGVLARRIDPASEVAGRLSLDVAIEAHGGSLEDLLVNGQGHLDFAVWPGRLKADLFEMWAVNVVDSLANQVDDSEASAVNCVVARFRLGDGVLQDHVIFADTTRMRIDATAEVDFSQRTLRVRARPRAKRPEFFSLATPAGLAGSFDEFAITLNPIAVGGSAISFVTSPVHVPIRRLFREAEPADGDQACADAWRLSDPLTDAQVATTPEIHR